MKIGVAILQYTILIPTILLNACLQLLLFNLFPQALKFKILIKNKKVGTLQDTILRRGLDTHGEVVEFEEEVDQSEDEEAAESKPTPKTPQPKRKTVEKKSSSPPRKKPKVKCFYYIGH